MKLTDGTKLIDIKLIDPNTGLDWSLDFFEAGSLEYLEDYDAYVVRDVDYCIDQAFDWKNSEGDFKNDEPNAENQVTVEEIEITEPIRIELDEMPFDKFTSWEDEDGNMRQGFIHATGYEVLKYGRWETEYIFPDGTTY